MIIAGPSPTLDRTISVASLDPGTIQRGEEVGVRVGGGGANAARVARRLGADAHLVTVIPEADGVRVVSELRREGIELEWVGCRGRVRVATIVRERAGRVTVLHEPGARVGVREWEEFAHLVAARLPRERVLLCSGSLPAGAPLDGYARFSREARHAGARCVVDAAGRALEAAIESREGIIVPNLAEAESLLLGVRPEAVEPEDAPERARAAAEDLLRQGAAVAIVTAGSTGTAFAEPGPRGRRGWVPAPRVPARYPVGAGDAFAAGLAARLEVGAPLDSAVAFAVAVAAEYVESGHGPIDGVGREAAA